MSEFRIDQIKSQDATRGPDVAGITTFTGTSGIVMPSGDTAYRGGRGRGLFAIGFGPSHSNTVNYITISTTGDAVDFGDLTRANDYVSGLASSVRGVWCGGNNSSDAAQDTIDYVTISSTGNAFDFGDLNFVSHSGMSCSNGHGGL